MKYIFILIFFCLFYNETQSNKNNKTEIWLHRAQDKLNFNNSNINKLKFDGAEIDIFFNENDREFYLSHDYPKNDSFQYFKINKLKSLNNVKLWLDFKNLENVKIGEAISLKKKLKEISIKNVVYIESQNIFKLKLLSSPKIKILYNLPLIFEDKIFVSFLKYTLKLINFSNFSISANQYNLIKDVFKSENIFIYTVNNKAVLCKFIKDKAVKVILTDTKPQDFKCI